MHSAGSSRSGGALDLDRASCPRASRRRGQWRPPPSAPGSAPEAGQHARTWPSLAGAPNAALRTAPERDPGAAGHPQGQRRSRTRAPSPGTPQPFLQTDPQTDPRTRFRVRLTSLGSLRFRPPLPGTAVEGPRRFCRVSMENGIRVPGFCLRRQIPAPPPPPPPRRRPGGRHLGTSDLRASRTEASALRDPTTRQRGGPRKARFWRRCGSLVGKEKGFRRLEGRRDICCRGRRRAQTFQNLEPVPIKSGRYGCDAWGSVGN